MKKISSFICTAAFGLLIFVSELQASINAPCSDTQLRVKSVLDEGDTTITTLTLRTTSETAISLYPPGTDNAFFAIDAQTGEKSPLIGFEGVAAAPGSSVYPAHHMVYMKLIFKKISGTKFHLVEGTQASREDFWTCMNIEK